MKLAGAVVRNKLTSYLHGLSDFCTLRGSYAGIMADARSRSQSDETQERSKAFRTEARNEPLPRVRAARKQVATKFVTPSAADT